MANTLSAKKRVRASLRKRHQNRATRSAVKTLVARARKDDGSAAASLTSEEVRRAISALDKAAEKGVLHRNNASRRKARLMHALSARAGARTARPSTATAKPASTEKPTASAKPAAARKPATPKKPAKKP